MLGAGWGEWGRKLWHLEVTRSEKWQRSFPVKVVMIDASALPLLILICVPVSCLCIGCCRKSSRRHKFDARDAAAK